MEKEYRYATEGLVNMYLSKYQILQQQELNYFIKNQNIFDENSQCNIYFILKRPRTTINPNYFIFNNNFFEIEIKIQVKEQYKTRLLKLKNLYKAKNAKLISEYPYNYFEIKTEYQEMIFKTGALLDSLQQLHPFEDELLDYEVLYIGQSFGEDGNKNATGRLISHSTLQEIYNEAITKHPDSEIWLMLCSFVQLNFTSINGRIKIKEQNENLVRERLVNFMDNKFSVQQKINFTEAALIRTFQPKFNKEYKNTFPNPAHRSYSECYKLDLNGIIVDIDLSDMNRWLYSEYKPRGVNEYPFRYQQYGKFHFVNDEDRYRMFNNDYI